MVVGGRDIARIPCSGGDILRPGVGVVPTLPWELQVLRQSDQSVLLTTTVTTLPKWLLLVGNSVALGYASRRTRWATVQFAEAGVPPVLVNAPRRLTPYQTDDAFESRVT